MTKSRAAVQKDYKISRQDRGDRRVTVWLTPAGLAALERLKGIHGSKDAALEHALRVADCSKRDAPKAQFIES
jgi:DNA-binding MarR family transcriptional regulator